MPVFMVKDFRTPVEKFEMADIEIITKYPMRSLVFLQHL